ncbi:MAG: class I SAM-dependent methyltransferase [Schleiferiaceae bacterium]|jgi:hypothetical protein|nr:class I SAM-dependent methyltransferase [Schleiferiaceae bacterium]|tara:strand:+ start:1080 stop:1766 length:687 start_codon:yes stop_codon:yes gene_type:complete
MKLNIELPSGKEEISIKLHEAEEIREKIIQNSYLKCLEVGLAYGMSANYILSSSEKVTLVSIDPFQENDYNNLGLQNISNNGFSHRHEHISELSITAFPELIKSGDKYDFIFIDGDHKFEGAFIDFIFSTYLINNGGMIVFDDLWMRALRLVREYVNKNRPDFKEVEFSSDNIFGFKKVSDDYRDGMYFREFYTRKGFLKYHINRLAWENDTLTGKLLKKLKSTIKNR